MKYVWHWLVLTLGLYLITLMPFLHISYAHPSDLFWAALVLILANTFVRPILILISLPLVLLSLGLFLLIINALILYTLPHFVPGIHVPTFLSAFFGALLLSLITGLFTGHERRVRVRRMEAAPSRRDEVIDI